MSAEKKIYAIETNLERARAILDLIGCWDANQSYSLDTMTIQNACYAASDFIAEAEKVAPSTGEVVSGDEASLVKAWRCMTQDKRREFMARMIAAAA